MSMYLVGWLHFPILEKGPFVDVLCFPAVHSHLVTSAICSGVPPMQAACVLLWWWTDYYGLSSSCGWLLVHLGARTCLVKRLLATGEWGQVMRWLAVEPQGVPGLVLAYWQVESSYGVGGCEAGVPGFSIKLLVGGTGS